MKNNLLQYAIALSLAITAFSSNAAMIINPSVGWSGYTWAGYNTPGRIWLTDNTTGFIYETTETRWGVYVETNSTMTFRLEVPGGDYISISENSLSINGNAGPAPAQYIYHVRGFVQDQNGYTGDVYIGSYTTNSNEDGFAFPYPFSGNREQFERFTSSLKPEELEEYLEMWSSPGGFEYEIPLPAGYTSLTFAAWTLNDDSDTPGTLASAKFSSTAPVPLPAAAWMFISGLIALWATRKRKKWTPSLTRSA